MSTMIPTSRTPAAKNSYDVLPDGDYPARLVRFIGLGVQAQKPYQGQAKDPAFKCSLQFELIGVDATGRDGEGKPLEARPACQFKDLFLFPNAKRGGVFDFCRVLEPGIEKAPGTLEWFINKLDSIVSVTVGSYTDKAGNRKNCINAISAIPSMFKSQVGPSRCELVGFNPYVDTTDMMASYSKLFKFQRDMLAEAHDRDNIPFAGKEPMKQESPMQADRAQAQRAAAPAASVNDAPQFDDDVPF
ncbi:MAG: hypothetical protein ACRC6V_01145 [Bacteroidales bacterium]